MSKLESKLRQDREKGEKTLKNFTFYHGHIARARAETKLKGGTSGKAVGSSNRGLYLRVFCLKMFYVHHT